MPYYDSTGTVADAITFFGRKLLSACCSALRILLVRRWLRPYNGWMSLPYETRGVLPRFISHVFGDGMIGSRSLAFCFLIVIPVPPSCGGLTSCDNRFLIAADSQEEDYSVHEGL